MKSVLSRIVMACSFVLALSGLVRAQPVAFRDVKATFSKSPTDRQLVQRDVELIFDDQARKMIVKSQEHGLQVSYDDIQKVVFDSNTHMRGGKLGRAFGGFGAIGGVANAVISGKHVTDSWCYLEYRGPDGALKPYMLVIPTESSAAVIDKMRALFGDKTLVADFPEKAEDIKKDTLKDLQSKHDLKVEKTNHPVPELMPDKALVVVVCPRVPSEESTQIKLHANDRVVLVNRTGTYGFLYLDPGEYVLASQSENASAIRMTLEAGRDYYFLQDPFMGGTKNRTTLSRHTKELVSYLLDASFYSDWKRK
jgi:hypothetical protein